MGAEDYYFAATGDLYLRPARVKVRVTFTASGATATKSTTRRQSDPDTAVAVGTTGQYLFTLLPKGQDYHITSCELVVPAGTQLPSVANVTAFDAGAGTMTVQVRRTSDGVVIAPTDNTQLHLSFDVETGAYS